MNRQRRTLGIASVTVAVVVWGLWLLPGAGRPAAEWGPVPDAWRRGLALLETGEAAAAAAALAEAETELSAAPASLLRARLHAALRAQQLRVAEFTAEKLAAAGDAPAVLEFVQGLAAYARCRLAALEADQPGADPTAFDRGILHARRAAAAFQRASLATDPDWPAARRNAERALARLAELEQKKRQRDQQRKKEPDREPPPDPDQVERQEQELPIDDQTRLLTPAELQALLDRLAEAEQEKRSIRREAQRARGRAVEQDW